MVVEAKTPRQIERMRQAGRLLAEVLERIGQNVRPGVTTAELDAVADELITTRGAYPVFKGYTPPGRPPYPASTCMSVNEEVVHGIPGNRKLAEGDIVSIDTGCKVDGWCADAAVTVSVGRIDPEKQRLLDVTRRVLELAIELMGTSSRWSEVAAEMEAYVKDNKFSVVEAFVGHGIGRQMHEDPQVPNFYSNQLRRSGDFRLVPGLVIAIEPMVNMGTKRVQTRTDHWTQSTADGRPSAHFEHTVAITESGPFVLTSGPNGESW